MATNKENIETIDVKIGNITIPMKVKPGLEMYYELIANNVNEKYKSIKANNPDTIQSYALTALEIAAGQVDIEQKLEEKIVRLENVIENLVEQIDAVLPTK